MLTIALIICAVHGSLLPIEVPGPVHVGQRWITVPAIDARFSRDRCWVETTEVEDVVQ
jgi:hypothetical protein